jgi:thioredoxin 1
MPSTSVLVALDETNFEALVLAPGRTCLVDFYLPTCPACQSMLPVVAQLAADFEGRALVGTLDGSQAQALVAAYDIRYVPTLVFFKDGQEVTRSVGVTSYDSLATTLNTLLASP